MEEDVKGEEATGEADEETFVPMSFEYMEALYHRSEGVEWNDQASHFGREFLAGKEEMEDFLKVPVIDLDYFCHHNLHSLPLMNLLADAVMFFKLHSTWEVFICPSCLSWFTKQDSLILHLMCKHFNARPFLQHNPTEDEWCTKAIRRMVWKPIDVVRALDILSMMSIPDVDVYNPDRLVYFDWPLSQDSSRSNLLTELREGVEMLLASQDDSIRMLSNHCLRALITVASHYILRHLDPRSTKPNFFRSLFYCSPFSFRFMENESLSCFVELVKQVCKLVEVEAYRSREAQVSKDDDVLWSKENLDAVYFQDDCDSFLLDPAKINMCAGGKGAITSWLFEAPIAPSVPLVPSGASKILKLLESKAASFSERLTTFGVQSDFRSTELTSWIKLCSRGHWLTDRTRELLLGTGKLLLGTRELLVGTRKLLLDVTIDEVASSSRPHFVVIDHVPSPCSHPATEPTKRRRVEFDSEMMQQHLELIKLTCELQLLVLQVCQHSAVDLRMFIFPLLRSSLRMKLFIFLLSHGYRVGPRLSGVEWLVAECLAERFVRAGCCVCSTLLLRYKVFSMRTLCWVSEESWPEEHPKEHAPSNFEGEHDAGSNKDVTTPYKGTCKMTEKSSLNSLGIGSSSINANSVSEVDPMMMDGTDQEAGIDGRASHITSADTALVSRSRTSIATEIARFEAEHEAVQESDYVPESKAEPGDQLLKEEGELFWDFETSSDSDSRSESSDESEAGCQRAEDIMFPHLGWYVTESRAWKTQKNGLFFRIKITDVVKHFLDGSRSFAAQSIWEWKSNRNLQYWFCFSCKERFADQVSHMVHMERTHQLGLSCNYYSMVPSQVWQEDLTGANEDVKKRTPSLDDCIEVDETYSSFLVDVTKIRPPFPNEDQDEVSVERSELFVKKVEAIRHQLSLLRLQFDSKCNLHWTFQDFQKDAELVQNFAKLEKLKQELSKLCVFDYKDQILRYVADFVQGKTLMNMRAFAELTPGVCTKLQNLLGSISSPYFPNSVSTELKSIGKVIVNFPNTEIGFSYTGLSWRFHGDLPFKRKRTIIASFLSTGVSWGKGGYLFDNKLRLDKGNKKTSAILDFKSKVEWKFSLEVDEKLRQFVADFCEMLHGRAAVV